MMTSTTIVHDQTGRVIERTVDHGDGTATRTTWPTAEADPVVETITVPVDDAGGGDVGAEALIASARADVAAATSIAQLRTRTLALDALRAERPGVM